MTRTITCETCGGSRRVLEYRPYAGEYIAGEPVEIDCHDCEGEGSREEDIGCPYCGGEIDSHAYCASCEEYALTEMRGDPFPNKMRNAA